MVYILSASPTRNIYSQSFISAFLTCFWFVFFQRIDKGSSTLYTSWVHFRTFLCTCFAHRSLGKLAFSLFNFQGPLRLRLSAATRLLYHSFLGLSIPFLKFFKKFFDPASLARLSAPSLRVLAYYTTFFFYCQYLFGNFFRLFLIFFASPKHLVFSSK